MYYPDVNNYYLGISSTSGRRHPFFKAFAIFRFENKVGGNDSVKDLKLSS